MRDRRAALGAREEAVLASILQGRVFPPQYGTAELKVARASLLRKRKRTLGRAWPRLAEGLGDTFDVRFEAYVSRFPSAPEGGALVDGWRLARSLREEGMLPGRARAELAAFELQHRVRAGRAVHRKAGFRIVRLPDGRAWALGVLLGRGRLKWWVIGGPSRGP